MPDNKNQGRDRRGWWLAILVLACPSALYAEESKLNKLRSSKEDKLAARLGEMVVNAAHPTGKKVSFVRHELKDDPKKENRKIYAVKMEYYGALTGKRYVADIEFKVEVSKSGWEVLDIDYTDNNTIKASLENIQQLKKKLNQPE